MGELKPIEEIPSSSEEASDFVQLGEALKSLSPQQQALLHLVFYQNMSLNDAAQALEISGGSARKQYHRAKSKLKILETVRV